MRYSSGTLSICCGTRLCSTCKKCGLYVHQNIYYCTRCAKKAFVVPLPVKTPVKPNILPKIIKSLGISKTKRADILHEIDQYNNNHPLSIVQMSKASEMSMIDIGKAIRAQLDTPLFLSVDKVLIENQIGPLAIRMKSIQGQLTQFFLMKGIDDIEFISAANKLKGLVEKKNTTYKERKTIAITETKKRVNGQWLEHFESHQKKDDLADCYLQAVYLMQQ